MARAIGGRGREGPLAGRGRGPGALLCTRRGTGPREPPGSSGSAALAPSLTRAQRGREGGARGGGCRPGDWRAGVGRVLLRCSDTQRPLGLRGRPQGNAIFQVPGRGAGCGGLRVELRGALRSSPPTLGSCPRDGTWGLRDPLMPVLAAASLSAAETWKRPLWLTGTGSFGVTHSHAGSGDGCVAPGLSGTPPPCARPAWGLWSGAASSQSRRESPRHAGPAQLPRPHAARCRREALCGRSLEPLGVT